jgi:hypothetical protein
MVRYFPRRGSRFMMGRIAQRETAARAKDYNWSSHEDSDRGPDEQRTDSTGR